MAYATMVQQTTVRMPKMLDSAGQHTVSNILPSAKNKTRLYSTASSGDATLERAMFDLRSPAEDRTFGNAVA